MNTYSAIGFPVTFLLFVTVSLSNPGTCLSQDDGVREEAVRRTAYVMAFMDEAVPLDTKRRKMAEAMVNIYVQSIIRTAQQVPLNDWSKHVYDEIRKNHVELLGSYLTGPEMELYRARLTEDAEGAAVCIYCDHPRKKDRDHCVFCGNAFE